LVDQQGARSLHQVRPDDGEARYTIRAVERVCDILDLVQHSSGPTSLAKIAAAAKLPKSSAFRYLTTLEVRRYVQRNVLSGDYEAGMALLPLQTHRLELLRRHALPYMSGLRDRFQETINLGVLDRGRIFYIEIAESPRGVRLAARRGDRDPIHSTALGKAIASTLKEDQVRAILNSEGMPQLTDETITEADDYVAALFRVREQGYALDDGENESDGRCVAVPLGAASFRAGLSLSAPAVRFSLESVPVIVAALQDAARLISELRAPDVVSA
jgi:IclR family acetate operon transcriptional repressor